ncbi:MAG: hypothetical protein ACRDIC_01515 [bacterium]
MAGQIKAGKGNLIAAAGEYAVMAELLKRGVVAALTPRNAPSFDILATQDHRTVRLRVKTKSAASADGWHYLVKKDGTLFRDFDANGVDDFTVLVDMGAPGQPNDYFVVPTALVERILEEDFIRWRDTPGKNGQPHDPTNRLRLLHRSRHRDRLAPYREAWDRLWRDHRVHA